MIARYMYNEICNIKYGSKVKWLHIAKKPKSSVTTNNVSKISES